MIVRLYHADRDVRESLDRALRETERLVLATQIQGARGHRIEDKTPFKEILEVASEVLDLVVVIDEGRPEGMWRDPFGELCDRLFTSTKEAGVATSGYVLLKGGHPLGFFRKALWDPLEDAELVTQFLSTIVPGVKRWQRPVKNPEPQQTAKRPIPGARKKTPIINPVVEPPKAKRRDTPIMETPRAGKRHDTPVSPRDTVEMPRSEPAVTAEMPASPPPPPPGEAPSPDLVAPTNDPYQTLGIAKGASWDEVRTAYRSLIIQYHPDKVSHLAKEFQALAETKSRELNEAFQYLEKTLKG